LTVAADGLLVKENAFAGAAVAGGGAAGTGGATGAPTDEIALMVVVIVDFLNLQIERTDSAPRFDINRNA